MKTRLIVFSFLASLVTLFTTTSLYANWTEIGQQEPRIFKNLNSSAEIKKLIMHSTPDGLGITIEFMSISGVHDLAIILHQNGLSVSTHCDSYTKIVRTDISSINPFQINVLFDRLNAFEPIEPASMLATMNAKAHETMHGLNSRQRRVHQARANAGAVIHNAELPVDILLQILAIANQPGLGHDALLQFGDRDLHQVLNTSFHYPQRQPEKKGRPQNCYVVLNRDSLPQDLQDELEQEVYEQRCPICQEELANLFMDGKPIIAASCDGKHLFCEECFNACPDSDECPTCRGKLTSLGRVQKEEKK